MAKDDGIRSDIDRALIGAGIGAVAGRYGGRALKARGRVGEKVRWAKHWRKLALRDARRETDPVAARNLRRSAGKEKKFINETLGPYGRRGAALGGATGAVIGSTLGGRRKRRGD